MGVLRTGGNHFFGLKLCVFRTIQVLSPKSSLKVPDRKVGLATLVVNTVKVSSNLEIG